MNTSTNASLSRRHLLLAGVGGTSTLALASGLSAVSASSLFTPENDMNTTASPWSFRRAEDRGHARHGWLKSHHTFSFANYYDPKNMGFGPLRVINDDRVDAGAGFPTHPHRDMEIITYVLEGALEHQDTTGGGGVIRPGDVQHMSAGRGVRHSEYNASQIEGVHFLQIWVLPERAGKTPAYNQKHFSTKTRRATMRKVASASGDDGSIRIGQDVDLYATVLDTDQRVTHTVAPGRKVWVHVAKGEVDLDGTVLKSGDAAYSTFATALALTGRATGTEVLTFDMG